MKKILINSLWATCMVLFLFSSQNSLVAGDALKSELTRHGSVIKSAFAGVVEKAKHLVVLVEINQTKTCPGTLVKYQAGRQTGFVVCKASLLGEHVSAEDHFRCQTENGTWQSAKFLGFDRELDMSFLKVIFTKENKQKKVNYAKKTVPGQWLVSVAYHKKLPAGVGVFGAEPRVIDSSAQGVLGISVDETKQGLAITKVMANSGAARAGFMVGDRLMQTREDFASKRQWLSKLMRRYEPGDWLPLMAKRGEEIISLDLQIGTSWDNLFQRQAMMNRFGSDVSERRTGFRSVIQHDTILHPMSCGGPIVNLEGELVGVNIARAGRTDTLAIPIQEILETAQKFKLQ